MSKLEDGKFDPDLEQLGEMHLDTAFQLTEIQTQSLSRRMIYFDLAELYNHCDGVVCVIDSTDKENLNLALMEMSVFIFQRIREVKAKVMLVLANKQDLDGALPVEFIEEKLREKMPARECSSQGKSVLVAGCSAKTREGLDRAFSRFLKEIYKMKKERYTQTAEETMGNQVLKKIADLPFV